MDNAKHLSPKQRRIRNREEMTAAIVQIAREIMREQGVATLNLSEIARRLGMQTPSLYEYFPNKMALYDHLFWLGTRLFRERMSQVATEHPVSPWDQLERFLTAYLQCAIDNPDLFKLVYERHVPGFVPSAASMAEANASLEEANQYLEDFLKAAKLNRVASIEHMRDLFIALMHGIAAQHLANDPDQPVGAGRFGSLVPLTIDMLKKAWQRDT